jgi:hypothetical protein
MGILCQLTVEQGAIPGAGSAYERKIRDLAARADLQRFLHHRRKVASEAAYMAEPPPSVMHHAAASPMILWG